MSFIATMQSLLGGVSIANPHEAERLSHCAQCSAHVDWTPAPSDGLPFYNFLIGVCCRLGDRLRALEWFEHIGVSGLRPDALSFMPFINLCAQAGDVGGIHRHLAAMNSMGIPTSSCAIHALMKGHSVQRDFAGVQGVMAYMKREGIPITEFSYNLLLHTCAKTERLAEAEAYISEMESQGIEVSVISYNCMINACIKCGSLERAQMWYERMNNKGVVPNIVTYGTMCKAHAVLGDVGGVERVISFCEAQGHPLSIHLYASWLGACECSKPRNREHAEHCLRHMFQHGVRTESLYTRFVRILGCGRVESLHRAAQQTILQPDEDTYFGCGDVTVVGVLSL